MHPCATFVHVAAGIFGFTAPGAQLPPLACESVEMTEAGSAPLQAAALICVQVVFPAGTVAVAQVGSMHDEFRYKDTVTPEHVTPLGEPHEQEQFAGGATRPSLPV